MTTCVWPGMTCLNMIPGANHSCYKAQEINWSVTTCHTNVKHVCRASPYRAKVLCFKCVNGPPINRQRLTSAAIVISDYDKGFITDEVIWKFRQKFRGPIYMDTKKKNLADFPGIYIKINQRELYESTSIPDPEHLIVTYGSKGCGYKDSLYPAKVIEVVDVCGAGDVFLAAMVYKHMQTGGMGIALPFANEKAAISCQSIGAVCVS